MQENKDYFGFNAHSGGYFPFEGVMDNDKEIDEINVDRTNSIATVKYADGYTFSVSATITETASGYKISNVQKSWQAPQNNQNNGV